jgi:hypothetical protein
MTRVVYSLRFFRLIAFTHSSSPLSALYVSSPGLAGGGGGHECCGRFGQQNVRGSKINVSNEKLGVYAQEFLIFLRAVLGNLINNCDFFIVRNFC